jgi:hypothetical protein
MSGPKAALHGTSGEAAPVALFVYARPEHTKRTLAALAANERASETRVHIFADAARGPADAAAVDAVRAVARAATGFRSVTLIERPENYGLARNITEGVSALADEHGKVIVLEDDLVTGPHFLAFMNAALDRYAGEARVWHVNGWTYPIELRPDGSPFFTPVMECWGWATWADRWRHYRKDPAGLLARWQPQAVARFNIGGGYDYWGDVRRNAERVLNTWAVFWYATIFEQGGLCLSPAVSHVVNIGIDGSGMNSGSLDIYARVVAAGTMPAIWPGEVAEDEGAWLRIRDFLLAQRPPLWRRAASRIKWSLKRLRRRG